MAIANITGNILTDSGIATSSLLPYTGATANVDLGVNFLKARTFYAEGNGGGGSYAIKNGATPSFEDGYTILSSNDYRLNILSTVSTITKAVYLGFSGVTATRTYTLPDASGTLALTSNLSAYLPLAGGTLTGALSGTSATFSGEIKSGDTITLGTAAIGGFWTWGASTTFLVAATGKALNLNPNGTSGSTGLSIATTGAATFSSSVTTNVGVIGNNSNHLYLSSNSSGGEISFWANQLGTRLMTITSGGNVGIGTSSPSGNGILLNARGISGNTTSMLISESFDGGSMVSLYSGSSSGDNPSLIYLKDLRFGSGNKDTSGYVERMRITSGGNVGIGTSSPTAAAGLAFVLNSGAAQGRICIKTSTTGDASGAGLQIGMSGVDAFIEQRENAALSFATNSTEKMRITSTGQTNFTHSQTNQDVLYAVNGSASPYGMNITFTAASPNNSTNNFTYFADSSGLRCRIMSNGGIANYSANNSNISDERTKKDIISLESYWDKFKAIEIVKFKYKDQTHDDFNIGVIAQQVEVVAPEFVNVDGFDKDEFIPEDGIPLKSIYEADLHHATIKVLQEAMARIEQQQAQIEELSNKIVALESK